MKRFIKLSSIGLGMSLVAFSFSTINIVDAHTETVVNDTFVFNPTSEYSSYNEFSNAYNGNRSLGSVDDVTLTVSSNYTSNAVYVTDSSTESGEGGFVYGDYSFTYGILPTRSAMANNQYPSFYVTGNNGTKIGMYYTLTGSGSSSGSNTSYSLSDNNTIQVVKETTTTSSSSGNNWWSSWWNRNNNTTTTTYEELEVYTESTENIYYSEFTFQDEEKVGIRSTDQYICLFALTIVTEEEIDVRSDAEAAIDELEAYYNTYGITATSYEKIGELLDTATGYLDDVNHISQIDNYDVYEAILKEYRIFVAEYKIDLIGDVVYTDECKEKIAAAEFAVEQALEDGITTDEISNYSTLEEAVALYEELYDDNQAALAAIEAINNIGTVTYTDESKALIDTATEKIQAVSDQTLITNIDVYNDAVEAYASLKADNEAALLAIEAINNIGTVTYSDESLALINAAKELIDNVNDQTLITNLSIYEAAVTRYNELKNNIDNAILAISELSDAEYTEDYKNALADVYSKIELVEDQTKITNLNEYEEKNAAFLELSEAAKNNFISSVDSTLDMNKEAIDNAFALYDLLIESDKEDEDVVAAYNELLGYQNSYLEYVDSIIKSDIYAVSDGEHITKILFIGEIDNYTTADDLESITIYVTDLTTNEEYVTEITKVYVGIRVSGVVVKDSADGVRYAYSKLLNDEYQYDGHKFSMYMTVVYANGDTYTTSSQTTTVEVGA